MLRLNNGCILIDSYDLVKKKYMYFLIKYLFLRSATELFLFEKISKIITYKYIYIYVC